MRYRSSLSSISNCKTCDDGFLRSSLRQILWRSNSGARPPQPELASPSWPDCEVDKARAKVGMGSGLSFANRLACDSNWPAPRFPLLGRYLIDSRHATSRPYFNVNFVEFIRDRKSTRLNS